MQTFIILLEHPYNTDHEVFEVSGIRGFSFTIIRFKNILEERWMWITR